MWFGFGAFKKIYCAFRVNFEDNDLYKIRRKEMIPFLVDFTKFNFSSLVCGRPFFAGYTHTVKFYFFSFSLLLLGPRTQKHIIMVAPRFSASGILQYTF